MKIKISSLLILCVVPLVAAAGAVKPNSLFSDGAVLQRGVRVPVWGTAEGGEQVTVEMNGQKATATADQDGKWEAELPAMEAGGPFTMKITGKNALELHDVYVGEVWVCSGQSNMERQLGPRPPQQPIKDWQQEAATANLPMVHEYFLPEKLTNGVSQDANGNWLSCSPDTAPKFSAVSFFFARALEADIKVPIGLLFTAWGGTPAEAWTKEDVLRKNPALASLVTDHDKYVAEYPARKAAYDASAPALMAKYKAEVASAQAAGQPSPKPIAALRPPQTPAGNAPGRLYNAMVAPLLKYPMRGVIWYQGESNGGRGKQYQTLFPAMIQNWREDWHEGNFPFLFVQIAPYKSADPKVREAQLLTALHTPNTAVIVTTDIGDANDIHPPNKKPVGERLALAARALAYGERIEYSGPLFESANAEGGKIVVHFTHAEGMKGEDGGVTGFEVAGPDKQFVPALAEVSGDNVIVSAAGVNAPKYVRYGFTQVPEVNLVNAAGLPASPFRTDVD